VESGTVETTSTGTGSTENGADGSRVERIEVHNPATGGLVGTIDVSSAEKVAETVARVRGNQPAWEGLGFEGRYRWLGRLRDWMLDNIEQIEDTVQAETGKARGDISGELFYVIDLINFYGKNAAKFLADETVRPHSPHVLSKKLVVQYRPHPVVGVISPWNFPLAMALGDSIPALQAGAAVVIKPSEFTPLSLIEIIDAWKNEVGGPDVFDLVLGTGEVAAEMIDHVDHVQFTGSDRTGRKVMARAAETLTPVSLELGGKDPMIVLSDADLDRAANAATWGSMYNSGQLCISVERIYVEEPVYDEFLAKLTKEVSGLRQGADGRKPEADVGAMTSPNQTAVVEDHVQDALANGARALTGGRAGEGDGDFYEPTVLVDVDHSMKVMRDETFGPRRSPAGSRPARSTSTTSSATWRRWACRWAAGSNRASAIATENRGSRSTAAASRSSSPGSRASANRAGSLTRRAGAACSTGSCAGSPPATSNGAWAGAASNRLR
jgi:acyl-CoA reductase-like NAD-dependent aldehyde dehydrogenase